MILKRQFSPGSMWPYVRIELALSAASSALAWLLVDRASLHELELPSTLATVLGTALSILLAVRVNTAYQRWWEGSGAWAQIIGMSRNLVRVVVTITDAKPNADPVVVTSLQTDIARRQIAYVTALRAQLRGTSQDELVERLDEGDAVSVAGSGNPAVVLLARQSRRIYAAFSEGLLSGFDNFQMEVALAGISTQQALAERLSMQPMPRTYNVFSRYLVHLYAVVVPFSIIGTLPRDRWLVVPATLIIAFAFRILERIGSVVEAPFGNTIQDVPLTATATLLERDLLELVGNPDRPNALTPVDGYLW
jgi:putative membrane protein